jgi:hypothetical protein
LKFNENFIGYEFPNTSYVRHNVIYNYNNFGHRCSDIGNIDFNNYILFAGCSHTLGEGLQLENSYPYITAKLLNCDYYNLGLNSSGFDIMFYNITTWLNLYPRPKLLVLQYPDLSRFSVMANESALIEPYGAWKDNKADTEFIFKSQDIGLVEFRKNSYKRLLSLLTINIPCIKLIFGGTKSYDDCTRITKLDYALDDIHYGPETHEFCAYTIKEQNADTIR